MTERPDGQTGGRVPVVRGNILLVEPPVAVGSKGWFTWLAEGSSFFVETPSGGFSVARRRDRDDHWQAYRTRFGKRVAFDLGGAPLAQAGGFSEALLQQRF